LQNVEGRQVKIQELTKGYIEPDFLHREESTYSRRALRQFRHGVAQLQAIGVD